MKKLVVGILAHVDAGKTTLSEGMLFESGRLRRLGRVDHQDAFLDHDAQERERGITIFSKQAILPLGQTEITLLDTPGHVDFSSEMERTLQVMDYAILVISSLGGVQSHTRTLWKLLERYQIPTFLFVNKMDLAGSSQEAVQKELQEQLSEGCVCFSQAQGEAFWESVAMCDEAALGEYIETGRLEVSQVQELIQRRRLFPCYYGSALKLQAVGEFLEGLQLYTKSRQYPETFGAKVYKIAYDPQGTRLTYLKVTGGVLKVRDSILSAGGEEKVNQIRLYSGSKYETAEAAAAGAVCAVTGLSKTYPGEGLGAEKDSQAPLLDSFLTYQVILPEGCEPHTAMQYFRMLEEEDPQLHVIWNAQLKELHVQLMGEIQLQVLQRLVQDRFGLAIHFGPGNIVYRETIEEPIEGMGHFEPLRHYAEVHLLLEPGRRGSGLVFATDCSEDVLEKNWQRLILTHLAERSYPGVLTGSPITDMKITLLTGRAHVKHTEGGDFRQATYRAVRQGLLKARSVLLEPWYAFQLEIPSQQLGRALADLQRMSAEFEQPETHQNAALISGTAPVAKLQGYALEVAAYTKGLGRLICLPEGYAPCHNADEVIAKIAYNAEKDMDNPGDSVFCAHGAGFTVKWNEADAYMHVSSHLQLQKPTERAAALPVRERRLSQAEDAELMAIFERTYGPIKQQDIRRSRELFQPSAQTDKLVMQEQEPEEEYLLVDGYNIIYAWEDLKRTAKENMDLARQMLMDRLCAYQSIKRCVCILVFDAYRIARDVAETLSYHNIYVVYTKQAETADTYIERATYEMGKKHRVRVATSDHAEQMIVLGHGAFRISAREFQEEVEAAERLMAQTLEAWNGNEGERLLQTPIQEETEKFSVEKNS